MPPASGESDVWTVMKYIAKRVYERLVGENPSKMSQLLKGEELNGKEAEIVEVLSNLKCV